MPAPGSLRRALGTACLALALLSAAQAFWIPAKAELAQLLMARAWQHALAGEPAPRPWPWADTWPVARLAVDRLGVVQYVLAGAGGSSLAFGPGHLSGTPTPGDAGNPVIAGHRDTSFRFLADLAAGDEILLDRPDGRRFRYRVVEARVVDALDPWAFGEERTPSLTLATCWPFDAVLPGGDLRYVVRARRVEPSPQPRGARAAIVARGARSTRIAHEPASQAPAGTAPRAEFGAHIRALSLRSEST